MIQFFSVMLDIVEEVDKLAGHVKATFFLSPFLI